MAHTINEKGLLDIGAESTENVQDLEIALGSLLC
jgi:hypothetical protein